MVAIICSQAMGCASQTAKTTPALTPVSKSVEKATNDVDIASDWTEEEEAFFDDEDEWESEEDEEIDLVADPIEPFNRAVFSFNLKLYDWVLRPVSLGYRKVTPELARVGLSNFFTNLSTPIRLTNCLLQGKGQAASAELSKFLFNSTFGILGFGDLFKQYPEMYPDAEDFGQTLGSYGIGDGIYVVLPVLGPSTLRDTVGLAGDTFLTPRTYLKSQEANIGLWATERVNALSFRIEDLDAARKAAFDPYEASRNFYIQSRKSKISK